MSVLASERRAPDLASNRVAWLASPYFFWGVLALYLAAHIVLRLWETPNIGKNDVQEALAAQGWAWGYHPRNPPLHTWLLMGSYSVFGVGLLAHVVLKYVLLGATYAFAYLSGRRLLSTPQLALMSALSVSLLTPFAWTVHTALTHTLLLAAIIFATLWAAIRLTRYRRMLDYVVLGVVIGLGFLAKYSYPLFLVPLLTAMLCQAEFRRVILHPAFVLTLAAAAAVFAPHGVWMATSQFNPVEFLAEKQRSEVVQPYLADLGAGLGHVALGALSFVAPLILLGGLALRGSVRAAAPTTWARTLMLAPVIGLAALALDVLVLRATQFEERYFMCALLLAPPALFAWLDERAFPNPKRTFAWFGAGMLAASLIVFAGLTGRALFYNQSCNRCLEEMAVGDLTHTVRAAGFTHGTVVADHYDLAGNMRIALPHARAVAANYVIERPPLEESGQCLLVWNARRSGDAVPRSLTAYLSDRNLTPPAGGPRFVDAPLYRNAARLDRLAYWVLPNADGDCRPR